MSFTTSHASSLSPQCHHPTRHSPQPPVPLRPKREGQRAISRRWGPKVKQGQSPKKKYRTNAPSLLTTTTTPDKADATASSKQPVEDINVPDGEKKCEAKNARVSGSDNNGSKDEV